MGLDCQRFAVYALSVELRPSETNELIIASAKNDRKAFLVKILLILLLLLAFALAWRWTPLGEWINVATVIDWQQSVKDYPAAFYLVVGTYLLGSLVLFPSLFSMSQRCSRSDRSWVTFTPWPAGSPARQWGMGSGGRSAAKCCKHWPAHG